MEVSSHLESNMKSNERRIPLSGDVHVWLAFGVATVVGILGLLLIVASV